MKKRYEKPATCVVQIRHLKILMTSPVQGNLTDDDYDDWDSGGGK